MTDEQRYLMEHFGTNKVGDCKRCSRASDDSGQHRRMISNRCNSDICLMVSGLNWFRIKQKEDIAKKSGTSSNGVVKTIQKANFVGICHEKIVPPWVIRYSDATIDSKGSTKVSNMWYNTVTGVGGKGIYSNIEVLGDIIVCWKGKDPVDIEMYSTYCRDTNLLAELDGVYLDKRNAKIPIAHGVNVGVAQVKDKSTGMVLTIIVSRTGKIIGFPFAVIEYIDREETNGVMIQLDKRKFIRLTPEFEVVTKSRDLPIIPIK